MPTEVKLRPAPQVAVVAAPLIAAHHPDLAEAEIAYLFHYGKRSKHGKVTLGTAQKASELMRVLLVHPETGEVVASPPDFVIIISWREWATLNDTQRRALVDHELCHCAATYDLETDTTTWTLRGHDLEEFREIVERYGVDIFPDTRQMADSMAQLRLPIPRRGEETRQVELTSSVADLELDDLLEAD